jgi:hypothetical protein
MKKLLLIFAAMAFLAVGCTPDFERYWESNLNAELPEIGDGDVNDDVNDDEDGNGNEGGEGGAYDYFTGKQWIWTFDSEEMLFDFGWTRPGYLILAKPSNGGYSMNSCGTYEVEEISDTEGCIIRYVEDDGETVAELYYYEIISETQFAIIEENSGEYYPYYFDHVDDPYNINVNGASKPDESVLANGTYWIVANGNVATPLTSNYGYLKVTSGKNNPATNGFTFTYVSKHDAYTIQDNGGQYYYQSGNFDSYNRQATLPETGAYWKVEKADNNTYKITNLAVNKFVQYDPSYNSYGSYATQKGVLPELVSVVGNSIPYVVVDPSALNVEADKTSAQFTISANMPWTAEVTTGTATLSKTSGSADATVTVSFAANTSTTDSKQYEVTVKSAYGDKVITITQAKVSAAGEEVTETISGTFTYDKTANTLSLTTASGITITQKIASGTTAIGEGYNTATTLRVYKGHALTFSGKTITKIKLTHASNHTGDSVTASVGKYTAGSTSSEWIGEATQVVITNTGESKNVQLRPTKIEVTYKK